MSKYLNQRGDTLIEVLFAVTVLGVVVTGAINLSTRAGQIGQSAQERSEAVNLLQQQVELTRSDVKNAGTAAARIRSGAASCLSVNPSTGDITGLSACNNYGGSRYNISLTYDNVKEVYTSVANWEGIGTEGPQEASLIFRVRQ